jgi:hypothetical protein
MTWLGYHTNVPPIRLAVLQRCIAPGPLVGYGLGLAHVSRFGYLPVRQAGGVPKVLFVTCKL